VVRAGLAELRGLALRRLRLGREIAREDAAHARDVELAEAERRRLRLDRDASGAHRVGDDRIAFLDDDAALDRARERADLLERERVDELQLEQARRGRRLAGVPRGDAVRDDAELPAALAPDRDRGGVGPCLEALELLAQAPVGGARVGRDHHTARDVARDARHRRGRHARPAGDDRLRVTDPRRHP
jgi:hypothetical protein